METALDRIYILIYIHIEEVLLMTTTRVFQSGKSQAVRIPKDYQFHTDEVVITRIGAALVLTPKDQLASVMREGFMSFSDDFMETGRAPFHSAEREDLNP